MKPIWVLCNCNSREEAEEIGRSVLDKRLASCFDIFKRKLAVYFWPPKSGKKEEAKGALLVIETFEEKYSKISSQIKSLYSDQLPFIAYIKLEGISKEYLEWMKGEIK